MKRPSIPNLKVNPSNFQKVDLGQLPNYLGYQIRQAQIAVFRNLLISLKDLNLTPGEFSLLTSIKYNKGASQIELAGIYDIDKSTLSHSIKKMVERGLIFRKMLKSDRRYYGLSLTPTGRQLLKQVTSIVESQEELMESVLTSSEKEKFLQILSRICNVLGKPKKE